MKKILCFVFVMSAANMTAQDIEAVDSIDVETGIIYHANGGVSVDTISADTLDMSDPPVPQIPLDQCDSLMVSSSGDRYGVVWKDGKCGVFDIIKWENVTRIAYKDLWFSFRKEIEGEYYSYFGWDEDNTKGVIGVAEVNNQFVTICMPKNDYNEEKGKENEK